MNWDIKKIVFLTAVLGFLACGNNMNGFVSGLTATPGNGQVTLSWNPVNGATSYNVYYSTNSNVTPTLIGTLSQKGLANNSTTITGLTNGTTWYFIVTAVTTAGESAPSLTVSATPSSTSTGTSGGGVTGVTATKVGTGQVTVSWAAVSGAISYNVYYDTNPNVNTSSPNVAPNITGTSTTISSLATGSTWYFIVTVNIAPPSTAVSVPL